MLRLLTLIFAASMAISSAGGAHAAHFRGRVVKEACASLTSLYIACRSRPLQTRVEVVLIEVDGSVSRRNVTTSRAGRFGVRLAPGYYEFVAHPPRRGMRSMPVEITVPPEGTATTLKVGR
jgi:hypothetical protein